VIDEVNIHKERGFLFREAAFLTKESAVKGLSACATDGGNQVGPVVRSEGADFDPATTAQRLNR
jgi:hypothetical protein